jgi:hypothetical protein
MTISLLGWVATAVFATSYLSRKTETLARIQAAAACLWILYGIAIGAVPVIVANVIVAGAALYSSCRRSRAESNRETGRAALFKRSLGSDDDGGRSHAWAKLQTHAPQ